MSRETSLSFQRELHQGLRSLTSIREEIHHRIEQLHHYDDLKRRMNDVARRLFIFSRLETSFIFFKEIVEYEKTNESIGNEIFSYRVPSILDYVRLKSKQVHLHRQLKSWQRKLEIGEREIHQRRIDLIFHREKISHPWKSLDNPSSVLVEEISASFVRST